jgi:predicted nucleotide-binding protein (sugar kinase/HSP70/actin superfamily)
LRKALQDAGFGSIPVLSANLYGAEDNPGFKISVKFLKKAINGVVYGDLLMRVLHRVRPYEKIPGSANALHKKWREICIRSLENGGRWGEYKKNLRAMIRDFDNLELNEEVRKPKVGIVGEILVKFLPSANNFLVELLEAEGAEAVMPDLLDFFMYSAYNNNFKVRFLGKKKSSARIGNLVIWALEMLRGQARKSLAKSKRFTPPVPISKLAQMAEPVVSTGNQTGEGWFLTGEMLELIYSGVKNIVCTQPFACLPNHIVGKGVIKELRRQHPEANIVAVDYDPGASEVNQLNRIKLMLSTAVKNMNKE